MPLLTGLALVATAAVVVLDLVERAAGAIYRRACRRRR